MSDSTKRLSVLALAISLAAVVPLAAQARNNAPRPVTHQHATMQTASKCWATNFGFSAINCKPSANDSLMASNRRNGPPL
jgi:hypothetical protein